MKPLSGSAGSDQGVSSLVVELLCLKKKKKVNTQIKLQSNEIVKHEMEA